MSPTTTCSSMTLQHSLRSSATLHATRLGANHARPYSSQPSLWKRLTTPTARTRLTNLTFATAALFSVVVVSMSMSGTVNVGLPCPARPSNHHHQQQQQDDKDNHQTTSSSSSSPNFMRMQGQQDWSNSNQHTSKVQDVLTRTRAKRKWLDDP
ncbi:hypothetical protein OIO90_004156 [Microbotryomycetes sp. JL221]|nr:hypothetical protein OIO90_004156 [Microbotryomycetes sp. JL221]